MPIVPRRPLRKKEKSGGIILDIRKGPGHNILWYDKKDRRFFAKFFVILPLFPGETYAIMNAISKKCEEIPYDDRIRNHFSE